MGYYIMTGVVSLYQRVNVSLTYQLPSNPSADNWTIRTEATQQVHDHQFMVEHYYIRLHPIFQVMPSTPAAIQCFERTSQAKRPAGSNKTKQTKILVVRKCLSFFLLCVVVVTYKQLKYTMCVSYCVLLSDPSFS